MAEDLPMMETEGCIKKLLMKATNEDLNNEIHDFTLEIITDIMRGLLILELDVDQLEKNINFIFCS